MIHNGYRWSSNQPNGGVSSYLWFGQLLTESEITPYFDKFFRFKKESEFISVSRKSLFLEKEIFFSIKTFKYCHETSPRSHVTKNTWRFRRIFCNVRWGRFRIFCNLTLQKILFSTTVTFQTWVKPNINHSRIPLEF